MLPIVVYDKLITLAKEEGVVPNDLLSSAQVFYRDNIPAQNIFLEKGTANAIAEFSLAGYSTSDIGINFKDDYLNISLKGKEVSTDLCIKKGINSSSVDQVFSYYIPFSKFDVASATSTFVDGLLTVFIPLKTDNPAIPITIN